MQVHGDSQVVRDIEVEDGELRYCESSGPDQIQDVTMALSGEVDMLCEVEAL